LADLIGDTDEVNAFYGESDVMLEKAWSEAIKFLLVVAPLIRAGLVVLVAYRWLSDFTSAGRIALQGAFGESFGEDAVMVPRGAFEHADVATAIERIGAGKAPQNVADAMALYELLSNTRLIPLARTEAGRQALQVVAALEGVAVRGQVETITTDVLVEHRLPGVESIPFESVVALRLDDEAFEAWRTSFRDVVLRANNLAFISEKQYRSDLAEAADDLLKPKIAALEKSLRGSSALRDLIRPNATLLGVGGLVAVVSHNAWGLVAASGTALIKFGVDVINKKLVRTPRNSETLRDLYAYLVTDAKEA
jgi:hypothetical protein